MPTNDQRCPLHRLKPIVMKNITNTVFDKSIKHSYRKHGSQIICF